MRLDHVETCVEPFEHSRLDSRFDRRAQRLTCHHFDPDAGEGFESAKTAIDDVGEGEHQYQNSSQGVDQL